ncbi:CHRD domain-containing protein [Gemmatimonas groenlandica]|uniref:CHRD domain-containing protein n=2 Tax=Gemmatimonas groenlandica TaxID=2732249 RepID=A0A6M4IKK2_9BACT|nr:CHRD domain-containing protein [Gemmatimonas groenlandica]QJR35263.1 CHRD domain-containing protein [Gemmatimonas groenlandica]
MFTTLRDARGTRAAIRVATCAAQMSLLFTLAACSGGDGGTTTPTPTAVAASVAVSAAETGALTALGATRSLSAVVKDASQATLSGAAVSWSTSNAAVATVSGSGATATITATGNGAATITATSGSVSGTVAVDVAQRFATLAVQAAALTPAIGSTTQLTATARDSRGNAIAGVTGVTYTSADRTKAIVSVDGLVTAIAPGAASVSASLTRDGVTATGSAAITVTAPISGATAVAVQATNANVFTPATTTIAEGGVVTFSFGSIEHNVLFQSAGAPTNVPVVSNSSVARTFPTAGSYPYVCSLHAGMSGTVNVLPSGIMALLNGANERPNPVTTSANGAAVFTRNGASVTYTVTYQGIASIPTGAHIHAPAGLAATAGVIVDLVKQTQTSNSGVLTGTFTASDIRGISGQPPIALDSLMTLLRTGNAYVNVHSTTFPAGEIRGQTGTP